MEEILVLYVHPTSFGILRYIWRAPKLSIPNLGCEQNHQTSMFCKHTHQHEGIICFFKEWTTAKPSPWIYLSFSALSVTCRYSEPPPVRANVRRNFNLQECRQKMMCPATGDAAVWRAKDDSFRNSWIMAGNYQWHTLFSIFDKFVSTQNNTNW